MGGSIDCSKELTENGSQSNQDRGQIPSDACTDDRGVLALDKLRKAGREIADVNIAK